MSVPETLVVLDDVIVVYRPFTKAKSRALRGFVQDARRLGSMRFFKEVPTRASLTFDNESGLGLIGTMQEPEDEALRAAITQFRQLYDHNEPRSFNKQSRYSSGASTNTTATVETRRSTRSMNSSRLPIKPWLA